MCVESRPPVASRIVGSRRLGSARPARASARHSERIRGIGTSQVVTSSRAPPRVVNSRLGVQIAIHTGSRSFRAELSSEEVALAQRRSLVGDDPLPHGLARNRKALEAVIRFAHDQQILPRLVLPEEVFAHNTLELE